MSRSTYRRVCVWCVVCGVWCLVCVVCGVWCVWCVVCVVYGVCGVCGVWCVLFACLVCGVCGLWCVVCGVWYVVCVVCVCGVCVWCEVCGVCVVFVVCVCVIVRGSKGELLGSGAQSSLRFCFWGCMKGEVYNRTLGTPDELLSRIAAAAACTNKREVQLRQTTRKFPHSSLLTLRLIVGFSKVYC